MENIVKSVAFIVSKNFILLKKLLFFILQNRKKDVRVVNCRSKWVKIMSQLNSIFGEQYFLLDWKIRRPQVDLYLFLTIDLGQFHQHFLDSFCASRLQ
jgi:hypothetical protein